MSEQKATYTVGWTVSQLAKKAGVSGRYIRQLIGEGKLDAVKASHGWLIPDSVATDWLASRANKK